MNQTQYEGHIQHLLSDLVPPIDREYAVPFFFNNKYAVQGDVTKQREAFLVMYPHFAEISRTCRSGSPVG